MEQPKDMVALKSRILSQSITLAEHHQRIVRIAVEQPDLVAFGTAKSVADTFAVSPSTVLRLTQTLGFKHFREFRELFRDHLKSTALARESSKRQND